MTLFGNWVVEVSFFGLRFNIHVCNVMHLFLSATNCDCMCKIYDHRAEIVQMHFTFSTNIGHLVTSDWNIYSFCCGIPLFICASTNYKKTKRNSYCTKCGYIAIRCRMLPIQYAHENVTVLAIFIKLRMQFISIACGPIQIHRKSQRTAHNIL